MTEDEMRKQLRTTLRIQAGVVKWTMVAISVGMLREE